MKWKGKIWQYGEINAWRDKHVAKNDIHLFTDRIASQNERSVRIHGAEVIQVGEMNGSIGAVDGTFCLRPHLSNETVGESSGSKEALFTNYKKATAYHLVLITSHGINNGHKKYILDLRVGNASSDSSIFSSMAERLHTDGLLAEYAFFVADHAFQSAWRSLCPYTSTELSVGDANEMSKFNKSHSSDRMASEHGNRQMKMWGIIRGRIDYRLFHDETYFIKAVECVWGMHNYILDDCPVF